MKTKTFGPGVNPAQIAYMGIDQSFGGFGITILGEDDSYITTVVRFDSTGVFRLHEVYDHVNSSIADLPKKELFLSTIAMEGYAYGSQVAHKLGELGGVVKLSIYHTLEQEDYGVAYPYIIPPTTLKKYVTGKGNGVQKNQILLRTYQKWGAEFTDDNAADSYALAKIASGYAKTDYEKEIIEKVTTDPKYKDV